VVDKIKMREWRFFQENGSNILASGKINIYLHS